MTGSHDNRREDAPIWRSFLPCGMPDCEAPFRRLCALTESGPVHLKMPGRCGGAGHVSSDPFGRAS